MLEILVYVSFDYNTVLTIIKGFPDIATNVFRYDV